MDKEPQEGSNGREQQEQPPAQPPAAPGIGEEAEEDLDAFLAPPPAHPLARPYEDPRYWRYHDRAPKDKANRRDAIDLAAALDDRSAVAFPISPKIAQAATATATELSVRGSPRDRLRAAELLTRMAAYNLSRAQEIDRQERLNAGEATERHEHVLGTPVRVVELPPAPDDRAPELARISTVTEPPPVQPGERVGPHFVPRHSQIPADQWLSRKDPRTLRSSTDQHPRTPKPRPAPVADPTRPADPQGSTGPDRSPVPPPGRASNSASPPPPASVSPPQTSTVGDLLEGGPNLGGLFGGSAVDLPGGDR